MRRREKGKETGEGKLRGRVGRFMGAVLLSSLLLAACGGQEKNQTSAETAYDMAADAEWAAPGMGVMPNAHMVAETGAARPQEAGLTEREGVKEEGALQGGEDTAPLSAQASRNRKLIRNVDLNMETREFDVLVSRIKEKTEEMGGYIESSNLFGSSLDSGEYSGQRRADFTVRIPADQLDVFLDITGSLGNVISRQEQVTDVTLQYSDVESHKKSLEIEQERLWELLEKAESLEAVVALEARLSEIRYQLESYTSQLRLYDSQVDYSTVNLYVTEVQVLSAASPDRVGERIQSGFAKTLKRMEDEAVDLVVWLAVNSPVILCLGVFVLVLILAVRALERHVPSRKKRGKKSSKAGGKEGEEQGEEKKQGEEKEESSPQQK